MKWVASGTTAPIEREQPNEHFELMTEEKASALGATPSGSGHIGGFLTSWKTSFNYAMCHVTKMRPKA